MPSGWWLFVAAALWGCAGHLSSVSVVVAGDLELSSSADPLAELGNALAGDVRICNLEGPFSDGGKPSTAAQLGAPGSHADWLCGRFEVVSLANNHMLDHGENGLQFTRARLLSVGVMGVERAHEIRPGVWLLARDFRPAINLDSDGSVAELVAEVQRRAKHARVIVSLHWGHTGSLLPRPEQRRLAARLVAAGASAILGHGPHTPQGVERRGGAVIAYSLGNLAFGCDCTDAADAFLLRFSLHQDGLVDQVSLVPISAGLRGAARVSTDPQLLELLGRLSDDLGSVTHVRQGILYID